MKKLLSFIPLLLSLHSFAGDTPKKSLFLGVQKDSKAKTASAPHSDVDKMYGHFTFEPKKKLQYPNPILMMCNPILMMFSPILMTEEPLSLEELRRLRKEREEWIRWFSKEDNRNWSKEQQRMLQK